MHILEHGQGHEKTLLFLPCTAEPVWAFEKTVALLAQSWHVFQVVYDGHEPSYPGDFTSVEQTVDEITDYLRAHGVTCLDAAYGCSLGGACLTRLLALDKMPVKRAIIDGGITHAGVAERVCAQMHVRVPIFGMVKDDRHRTRALVTAQGREIDLHAAPNVFALIGQIQEETHRFAITFHHESHSRSSTRSTLDGIPGVGKVRAQALLKTFKSVRAIREADIFALERVLPKDAAASVYLHFHGETDEKKDEM